MLRLSFLLIILLISTVALPVFSTDKFSREDFPPGFVFGAGSSAYQVEGAENGDGRSHSIWDTFTHEGQFLLLLLDQEDVQLMARTGLDAYKFSISWSRLIPNGRPVNPKGLRYYNNLINELIRHGIQPHVLLHHFDHPQALEDEYGGWISQKIVKDFTAYANVCFREFGDKVSHWSTVNEPNAFAIGGYDMGVIPPKRCSPSFGFNCSKGNSSSEPYLIAHHILAHKSTARLYREKYQVWKATWTYRDLPPYFMAHPSNSTTDVVVPRRAQVFFIGWIADPLVFGDYPSTMKRIVGSRLPAFKNHESNLVKGSFDFIGLTHYQALYIKYNSISMKQEDKDFNADMAVVTSCMLLVKNF